MLEKWTDQGKGKSQAQYSSCCSTIIRPYVVYFLFVTALSDVPFEVTKVLEFSAVGIGAYLLSQLAVYW